MRWLTVLFALGLTACGSDEAESSSWVPLASRFTSEVGSWNFESLEYEEPSISGDLPDGSVCTAYVEAPNYQAQIGTLIVTLISKADGDCSVLLGGVEYLRQTDGITLCFNDDCYYYEREILEDL